MPKISDYFNKADRKKLFFDYLKLVGVLEILIFIVVALWATDDKYHRVYTPFPWKEYLFVAFAFPIVLTFLMGVIISGFNHFIGYEERRKEPEAAGGNQFETVVKQLRRLPFLGLLFLLLTTIFCLYNIHHIIAWLSQLGYNTFLFLTYALGGLGAIVVIYVLFFLMFKYRLNKKHLQYEYYSQISDKFGLIILDDRTVLYKDGNLLVQGRGWRRRRQVAKLAPETELLPDDNPAPGPLTLPKP
jgi:hypothetical protein